MKMPMGSWDLKWRRGRTSDDGHIGQKGETKGVTKTIYQRTITVIYFILPVFSQELKLSFLLYKIRHFNIISTVLFDSCAKQLKLWSDLLCLFKAPREAVVGMITHGFALYHILVGLTSLFVCPSFSDLGLHLQNKLLTSWFLAKALFWRTQNPINRKENGTQLPYGNRSKTSTTPQDKCKK